MAKERPIIFSADMVNAILAGNKTQTRRVIKPQPDGTWARDENTGCHKMYPLDENVAGIPWWNIGGINGLPKCKYGSIGDKLWVRENCKAIELESGEDVIQYMSDMAIKPIDNTQESSDKWIDLHNYSNKRGATVPSIYMPRWASRILLEITDIRVERLNDISEIDAIAEGIEKHQTGLWLPCVEKGKAHIDPRLAYRDLWERINGDGSWSQNQFVFVIAFRRVYV